MSKTGYDRAGSYYTMCLIMPCAAVRTQTPRTVIAFVYMLPRLRLASGDRVVSEKLLSLLFYEDLYKILPYRRTRKNVL